MIWIVDAVRSLGVFTYPRVRFVLVGKLMQHLHIYVYHTRLA